jgi:DNA-binding transcriptional regulator YiaG
LAAQKGVRMVGRDQVAALARLRRMLESGQAETLRRRVRLSRRELARLLSVEHTSIWRWETTRTLPRDKEVALAWLELLDELADEPAEDDPGEGR